MKKSIISLIGALVLTLNMMVCPVAFAEDADIVNDFEAADFIGSEKFATAKNLGFDILQNEKYILIAEGTKSGITSNEDIHLNDKIHIYEKPNSEHLDYKFLTTIKQDSNNGSYDLPARDIYLYEDTLFVFWGNGLHTKNTAGVYSSCGKINPLKAYDLSDLEAGDEPVGTNISTGEQRTVTHAPFIRGGISYVDAEGGKLYHGSVMNASYGRREYYMKDLSEPTVNEKTFCTDAQSKNAVQFIVKDGYLYEILQQKAGNGDFKSVDATLVDREGNAINNTLAIYDVASGMEICAATGYTSIAKYKRGIYTTETEGDCVMKDLAVSGDYVYIATTNGLEVIDVASVKSADSLETLSLNKRISEGTDIKGVEIFGNDLYLGTDSAMEIYDISNGEPSLKATYTLEGGFCDFEVSEEENAIYALRNGAKGVVVIDKAMLGTALNVENFKLDKGTLSFSADVSSSSEIEFKSMLLLYKGNKLVDMSVKEWTASEEKVNVSDSFDREIEDYNLKLMFVTNDGEMKVIPMITEEGMEYEKEVGKMEAAEGVYDSSVNIAELDENGCITVSGNLSDRKEKPVLITVKNNSSDRLEGYRYIDVLNVAENGNYVTKLKPADSGDYTVTLSRIAGVGKTEINDINVPDLKVSVSDSVEIPGVSALLVLNAEYAQNVNTLDVELSFDKDSFLLSDEVELSKEFELINMESKEEGSVNLSFAKKDDIKTNSFEFCVMPIEISSQASCGNYSFELNVTAKDEFENILEAETVNGNIELVESTPKYDALDDAKEALSKLKKAEDITVEEYLDEKVKIEDAREKVEIAYSYLVRDSQLGEDSIANLLAAENRLTEIKPYYDAVELLNDTQTDEISKVLKENKDYFGLTEKALAIYDELSDSAKVDKAMADGDFEKPSEVKALFSEVLVLEAFKETSWQNVGDLLELLEEGNVLDLSAYKKLTYTQKTEVHKDMALSEYDDIDEIEDVLKDSVADAKKTSSSSSSSGSRPSGSGSGGGSKSSGSSIYLSPKATTAPQPTESPKATKEPQPADEPKDDVIFDDIENYSWAKEAILHLYNEGVVNGKEANKFVPSDNVKREEFAKMVVLAFDIESGEGELSFTDVKDDAWYKDYVYSLASVGIINGRDDGSFGIGDYITRQEIAVIIERIAEYKKVELKTEQKSFEDSESISKWAEAAMAKMYGSGILSGFEDNTVRPGENASRAQVAKIVFAAIECLN